MVGLLHDLHLTKRTIISLIIIGFLTISLPIGLYLSQQRQVLKSKAQECQQVCDTQLVCGPTCRPCGDAYPGECDDTGGADVCDGPQECHDEQVNCRQECINPLLAEENPPPEGPGETGGEVIGGIIDNVCHFFDNFLPGDQCGETQQPQPEPEQPQPEATVTPTPEGNQSTVSPQITSIETLLNGQPADLGTAQIADDDTVTVVVHVPVQLGQDYACRWNFDDGQGDTPSQDCQINKQFPAGFNTISVYLVNSAGEESDRKSFSFIVKPPPQISSIDTYLNGQLTNLSGRQVTVGSSVGVVVNVPAELGNDYACRFNIDDGGDSGFSDCQLTQSFDIGSHSISVYVVNNKGKQSQSQSISFVVVEPPPPPVVSGGGSRAEGTQVINQPAEYKTVEEQYTCGAYLVCESDGGYNTTGYAGKYYTNVTSNYTGSNVDCPPNTRVYAPNVCPVDQLTVGTKYIPDETFSNTRTYQLKAAQTIYQCEYTQKSEVYDCSNGQRCYNDSYSDQSTQCILKPKTPHYHCDPDPECEGKGEGWVPSQASCSESFTKEAYDCFDGKRWYNDFRRAPDTNCAWDKTSFHPEPDSSCRTANLTDSCQKKTDCQQGYYCQTDTGTCLQETAAAKAAIPELESSIPVIGGVLNGLGAAKDGAGNLVSGAGNLISGVAGGVGNAVGAIAEDPGVILDTLGSAAGNTVEFITNIPGAVGGFAENAVELVANAPVFYKGDQDQVRQQTQDGLARIIEANRIDKAFEQAQELGAFHSAACTDYLSSNPIFQDKSWEEIWYQLPTSSPCRRGGEVISQEKIDSAVENLTSIGILPAIEGEEPTDEQKQQYRQQTLEAFKESLKTLGIDYDAAAETRVIGTCFDTPSLPGGPALSVIGSTFNLPGLCFTTERLVPTDPSGGYIAVAKKEQAIDLARQLGLDWDNPQTWTDAETKRFFNTLANRDLNFVKTAIEGVIGLPITTHEDMEIALSLCRQVHGNLCELGSTNAGAYLELTQDEYQKAVNLYKANGNSNFQPTDLDLLQRFVAIPGATSLETQDDYGRRVAEQRIANELGISVDELKKVEATFNALDWAGDVTRSGTQEGRAFETKFNERNTEAAINIVTNIIDPTALIGGGIGITKFVTRSVKAKLAARVGVEAAEEVVNRVESALARQARAKAAGEAFDFTPVERQALEHIDNAAGDIARVVENVTPFISDTPENRELVQLTLDGFEDGGRLVRSDGPTTPAVVITDPAQADFIAVSGVDDVVGSIRNTVSDGLDNLFGRASQVDDVSLRAAEDQLDNLSDPVLRDAARDGIAQGEPVEVLTNAGDVVPKRDVAQTLHSVDAGIGEKELPVADHNQALFEDLLRANDEGEVALTITRDGRIYQLADAPEDGTSAVARLSRDTNGNLQVAELTVSDETSYTVTRQIDQVLNDVQPEKEVIIRRDSAEGVDQAIAQSDDLIGGRLPGEDGVGGDTLVPAGTNRELQAVVSGEPVLTNPVEAVIDSVSTAVSRASQAVRDAVSTKPVVNPVGLDESLQRISRVRQAVDQKQINDSELIQFWQSTVRDADGRFSYYQGQVPEPYYRGPQPIPNLNNPEIQSYLISNMDTREAFLKGLQEGKFKEDVNDFKEWLIDLHKKQAYKPNQLPGEIESAGFRISTDHTVIIRNDVLKLANKYGDTYADFLNSPNQFGFWKTLDLSEITESARPVDQVLDSGLIRHFYPEPQYFNEYFAAMQRRLIELDKLGKNAPVDNQLRVIADFYQYAINGRMFREVNQSLYMNIVNGLLEERGLKPIEHGILDFVAMRLEPANFQKYFIEEVERAQKRSTKGLLPEPCLGGFNLIHPAYAIEVPCPLQTNVIQKAQNAVSDWVNQTFRKEEPRAPPVTIQQTEQVVAKTQPQINWQAAKTKLNSLQDSYKKGQIDLPQLTQAVEPLAGVEKPTPKLAETTLLIDDKFLTTGVITGSSSVEKYFGNEAWVDWLNARITAKAHGDQPITVDFIKELHTQLTQTSNPSIGGKIRDAGVRGGDYTDPSKPVKYTIEQIEAIRSNPLLAFEQIGPDPNTGKIVYPSSTYPPGRKALESLSPELRAKLGTNPTDSQLVEALLDDLVSWYNNAVKDPKHDPYAVAAELQRRFISIHPFEDVNGRASRALMDWSLERDGVHPSWLLEPSDDITSSLDSWIAQVKQGSEDYGKMQQRARQLEAAGIIDPILVLGLSDLKTFYDQIYSKTGKKAPQPAQLGDSLIHPEYDSFLDDLRLSMREFEFEYSGTRTIFDEQDGHPINITVGGLIPESYINLITKKPQNYEAYQRYIREHFYADAQVYRGGVSEDAINTPEDVLRLFEGYTAIGTSYHGLGYNSPISTTSIAPSNVARTLERYNQLITQDFISEDPVYGGLDLGHPFHQEVVTHTKTPAQARNSPFVSTSVSELQSELWAQQRFLNDRIKSGVLFSSRTPSSGSIFTYHDPTNPQKYGIYGLDKQTNGRYMGIDFESEVLVPGGLDPAAIDRVKIYDLVNNYGGGPRFEASKIINQDGIFVAIKDSNSREPTLYKLNPVTGKYELSAAQSSIVDEVLDKGYKIINPVIKAPAKLKHNMDTLGESYFNWINNSKVGQTLSNSDVWLYNHNEPYHKFTDWFNSKIY